MAAVPTLPVRRQFSMARVRVATLLTLFIVGGTAIAGVDPINTNRNNVAIRGYDPVAYFESGSPGKGSATQALDWNGATWYFVNAENRAAFEADPQRYAPQYGGYCAWAVSQGSTANIDPAAWKIVEGKLYLNYSPRIQKKWERDIPGHIAAADEQWPKLLAR